MDIALMLEGQNGLNWQRLEAVAHLAEQLGFAGLYRSDHFTNTHPPALDSLELWVSLTWLAGNTHRLTFGPLVSPVSFRDPVMTARMALQVNDLSNGRLRLGVGAGWQDREHDMFGYNLLEVNERFKRFEEGLEVISRLMKSDTPVSFEGQYYRLQDAQLLPRPGVGAAPPIVIGGNGLKYTLPLAARFADEWNAVFITPRRFAELSARLDELVTAAGRHVIRKTMMCGLIFAADEQGLTDKLAGRALEDVRRNGVIVATPASIGDQLAELEQVGVQGVMLQWLDLDDLANLETLARAVL